MPLLSALLSEGVCVCLTLERVPGEVRFVKVKSTESLCGFDFVCGDFKNGWIFLLFLF